MSNYLTSIVNQKIKRRTFLKASAVATAVAGLPLAGCGNVMKEVSADEARKLAETEGTWVSAACWHNCGGRCLNKALVVDGVVIRQKTDDTIADDPDMPQQRGCARGRSQQKQVFGADRLKYPMKRKNWAPGGGNKELRGRDEWVRISWDEALDLAAGEIKRIKEKYGNEAFLVGGGGEASRLLSLYGGHSTHWGTTSWGTWRWGPEKFGMEEGFSAHSINDRLDLRNSKLVVLVGANPAMSAGGNPSYHYLQAKKAGAKFIVIDPYYTDTAEVFEADWIPIRPATDHALFLGMAHTLITEDDPVKNPLIEWDFLHRCTVGFDADHMPEGTDPKENFKDYVLGTYDGVPKSPEWQARITGVDPEVVRRLAREIAGTKKTALMTGWAPARTNNTDSWPHMFATFGAMCGHMGESGRMTGVSCHFGTANGGPRLVSAGGNGVPGVKNNVTTRINDTQVWETILEGKYTAGYKDVRNANIQMIYHGFNAILQTRSSQMRGIEAHRKVEFVLTQGHFLTTTAKYSDLVLPVTTEWERPGRFDAGNRDALFFNTQVVEPLYEAKHDQWVVTEIGKRLGLDPKEIYPIDPKQQLFNQIMGCKVMKPDGSGMEALVTITTQDIQEWGVEGQPQQGRISLPEFKAKGVYQVPRKPGDKLGYIGYEKFRQDPEANPLKTTTGKLEIHSQTLADFIKDYGFTEIDPIPTYNKATEGYEDTFSDWEQGVKGEFPLQVFNPHYFRRSHTVFDNIPWLREAYPNPVYLSGKDARERGIKTGETVLLSSRWGKSLRVAQVTERLLPGVVGLPHGAWVEIDEKTGIDKAGSDNALTGPITTGQGTSGWNTCNCQVEKWTGEPLKADVQWPLRKVL